MSGLVIGVLVGVLVVALWVGGLAAMVHNLQRQVGDLQREVDPGGSGVPNPNAPKLPPPLKASDVLTLPRDGDAA